MSYPKFVISPLMAGRTRQHSDFRQGAERGRPSVGYHCGERCFGVDCTFGEQENTDWNKEDIDWNAIDSELVSQRIVVTRPELNGKKLGSSD